MTLDPALVATLACPATRTPLRLNTDGTALISDAAGIAYPVREGVPVLLTEAGREVTDADRVES